MIKNHDYRDHNNQVKDVRVPEQLMRAMAAEAEAARDARAKVGDGDNDGDGGDGDDCDGDDGGDGDDRDVAGKGGDNGDGYGDGDWKIFSFKKEVFDNFGRRSLQQRGSIRQAGKNQKEQKRYCKRSKKMVQI